MQDEVNKIVFNALADGWEIWFRSRLARSRISECLACFGPAVGTSVPAYRLSLSEQRGVSVIDPIARAGACDVAAAEDIYSGGSTKPGWRTESPFPGSGEPQSPLFPARSATLRCRSQSSRTRSAAAETPISRLPLYLGIALLCTAAVGYGIWQYGEWGCGYPRWLTLHLRNGELNQ